MSEESYANAAEDYERGRLPYPGALESLVEAAVGRGGRLLDLGCGPGRVGLRLRGLFDELVGVDRDEGMVQHARRRATAMGVETARFVQASVEDLPADLGSFRVVVVAQAFHWFDGPRAAEAIRRLLEPGGHCVVLYAWSLSGDPAPESSLPQPPLAAMKELGKSLGALQADVPQSVPDDESGLMTTAGFCGPVGWDVPAGEVVVSSAGDVIARWMSRSDTAEFRTGRAREEYVAAAEQLLRGVSEAGFAERLRDARFNVWTKPT